MKKLFFVFPIAVIFLSACTRITTQTAPNVSPSPEPLVQNDETTSTNSAELAATRTHDPNNNLVQNLMATENASTAVKAVAQAGLTETLQKPGPFTIFVPTDVAFENMPDDELESLLDRQKKSQLVARLAYHVVPGEYRTADLTDGQKLKTVQGQEITLNKNRNTWTITDSAGETAEIETADLVSNNGITFMIDTVLSTR